MTEETATAGAGRCGPGLTTVADPPVSMETGGRGGGAVSARGGCSGARASAGGCRRKAAAEPGALAADMDLPRDGAADTPAADPPPSGRINKAAFKLFKRRKAGGPMPSIFGVRNKGDGRSSGPAGLARSKTHDGLAEVAVLEGGKRDEPRGGDSSGNGGAPRAAGSGGSGCVPAPGSVAKSHSFLSLLRRNARPEGGRAGEPAAAGKAGSKQKRGLKGLFGGVRWPRRDKRGPAAAAAAAPPPGLAPPGSLSASLECVPEEPARTARPPAPQGPADGPRQPAGELAGGDAAPARPVAAAAGSPGSAPAAAAAASAAARSRGEAAAAGTGRGRADEARAPPERGAGPPPAEDASRSGVAPAPAEPASDRLGLLFSDVTSLKSFDSLTGCGDVIAEPEDEAGPSGQQRAAGSWKPRVPCKTPGGTAAFQGGGEEMASPEQVDDTCLQEFWDMLSHAEEMEDQGRVPPARTKEAKAASGLENGPGPERPGDARGPEAAKDSASTVKRPRLSRVPTEAQPGDEPSTPGGEPQQGVRHGDEGHRDSSPPEVPDEDPAGGAGKALPPQGSGSGDAVDGLDGGPAVSPAGHDAAPCPARRKPGSPVAVAGPLRTPGSLPKDSRIPISIKHLGHLPAAPPAAPQQPARSELPRTKIPVSKVLVRRVSSRGLAGTTLRAAACHDGAKKL